MVYKIIISFFFVCTAVLPQTKETLYYLSTDIGLGYSRFVTNSSTENLNKNGFSGTFRITWHPEHLLSLGLETGYQQLYSLNTNVTIPKLGTSAAQVSMVTVPIFIIFSMKIFPQSLPNFEIKFGSGIFLLYNNGEVFGNELNSSLLSIGASIGATYLHPLNDFISIGGELRYSNISKIQNADLSLQFMFSYKFLHW